VETEAGTERAGLAKGKAGLSAAACSNDGRRDGTIAAPIAETDVAIADISMYRVRRRAGPGTSPQ
jgi:hypothetical protein